MSVTIAPVRLLMVGLILLMIWPLAAIGTAFRVPQDHLKPMVLSGWRRVLRPVIVFLCRGVFFVGGFHWITVRGVRTTSKDAPILAVAPHSSFFDSLALVYMELTSVVAKAESKHIPCFGKIIQYSQPVLVSREDPNSRQSTIKEIQRRSQSGGQWPQIFIFPEGTCSNRSCLISFKGGAFYPGVPVQPVCLRYHNKLDTITWTWDGPGAFECLWYTLCQFQSHLEIEFLPVYVPSEEEIHDPKLFGNNVRDVMAKCLQVPVSDHTYCTQKMKGASKLRLPMEAGIAEFQKLHKRLGIDSEQMKRMADSLKTFDHDTMGKLTLPQFASYLQVLETPAVREVFSLYDRDQSGRIDFREYIIGLTLVANPDNSDATLQCAFQLFDKGHKGYITHDELQSILRNAFAISKEDVTRLFCEVDTNHDGKITYEDFKNYAAENPEYAQRFIPSQKEPATATANGHIVMGTGAIETGMAGYSCSTPNAALHRRVAAH